MHYTRLAHRDIIKLCGSQDFGGFTCGVKRAEPPLVGHVNASYGWIRHEDSDRLNRRSSRRRADVRITGLSAGGSVSTAAFQYDGRPRLKPGGLSGGQIQGSRKGQCAVRVAQATVCR